jgi:prepilin peptidase CpaA
LLQASDPIALAVTAVACAAAVATDLRSRRIPNAVTLTTAVAGLVLAAAGWSGVSLHASMAGLVVGLVLMLPGHAFGGTGAGDVKLLAAVGTLLGPKRILTAFLYAAIAGGVLAVVVAIERGRLRRTLCTTGRLVRQPAAARREVAAQEKGNAFPYGPAIAAGSILAALGF